MNLLIILLITIALAIILYNLVIAYRLVYDLSHPIKYEYSLKSDVTFTYSKFNIKTKDNVNLKGIDYRPEKKEQGTILVCHYLGGSKEAILPFIEPLLQMGLRVLSFDFRNHGESDLIKQTKYYLEKDFDSFFDEVKSRGIKGPFGTMGFSMGATSALYALNKYSEVKATIVDSGPLLHVKEYFKYVLDNKNITNPICRFFFLAIYLYHVGFAKMSRNTIKFLKESKGKSVLFIHGEKDNIITINNSEIAYELLKSENASFWKVPNSRHLTNRYICKLEYENRITDFFASNLLEGIEKNDQNCIDFSKG